MAHYEIKGGGNAAPPSYRYVLAAGADIYEFGGVGDKEGTNRLKANDTEALLALQKKNLHVSARGPVTRALAKMGILGSLKSETIRQNTMNTASEAALSFNEAAPTITPETLELARKIVAAAGKDALFADGVSISGEKPPAPSTPARANKPSPGGLSAPALI